jgi:hypothetical protein
LQKVNTLRLTLNSYKLHFSLLQEIYREHRHLACVAVRAGWTPPLQKFFSAGSSLCGHEGFKAKT